MAEYEATSAEMTEVADQSEETGVEEPEVADQVSETEPEEVPEEHQKTDSDAAFAELRRAKEASERELADVRAELEELQAQQEARDTAYSRLTGKDEDGEIAALAELTGMSEDEIRADIEAAEESAKKDLRIAQLEEQVTNIEVERLLQSDLAAIQKIDPTIKSLEELGPEYGKYMTAVDADGNAVFTPEDAYWACKAKEAATKATPPKPVGQVKSGSAEKDYFTQAEIDAMSPEQLRKNSSKIIASWERMNGN